MTPGTGTGRPLRWTLAPISWQQLRRRQMATMSRRAFAGSAFTIAALAMSAGRGFAASDPHPIDEGQFVDINGVPQWITVRGANRNNPVLFWLHGGPGVAMSGQAPLFFEWEK